MKSKVALIKTSPDMVLQDYHRVMNLCLLYTSDAADE